jgi:hypothetical protein
MGNGSSSSCHVNSNDGRVRRPIIDGGVGSRHVATEKQQESTDYSGANVSSLLCATATETRCLRGSFTIQDNPTKRLARRRLHGQLMRKAHIKHSDVHLHRLHGKPGIWSTPNQFFNVVDDIHSIDKYGLVSRPATNKQAAATQQTRKTQRAAPSVGNHTVSLASAPRIDCV